jgi:hypothetical protein
MLLSRSRSKGVATLAVVLLAWAARQVAAAAAGRTLPLGLHFDIEPQALQEWNNPAYSQAAIVSGMLDLMDALDARWTANGRPVPWTWDTPNWYAQYTLERNGVSKTYADWVRWATRANVCFVCIAALTGCVSGAWHCQVFSTGVDRVCVMNFVDTYSTQVSRMTAMVALATAKNKPLCAVVETQNVDYNRVSFYEEGAAYMQNTLVAADATLRQMAPAQWQGYFLHDYEAMLELPMNGPGYTAAYVSNRIDVCVYVWEWWLALSNGTAARQQMWTYLAAQPYAVTRILFESEALLQTDQAALQAFIEEAATRGYHVELAAGFARWALPSYHAYVLGLMQMAANFIRLGPLADPWNPPTEGGVPGLPTNTPAPTVFKTDLPWPTSALGPSMAPVPTGSSAAATPTVSTGSPAPGTFTTTAPSTMPSTDGPTSVATATPPGRVPDQPQSSATTARASHTHALAWALSVALLVLLCASASV